MHQKICILVDFQMIFWIILAYFPLIRSVAALSTSPTPSPTLFFPEISESKNRFGTSKYFWDEHQRVQPMMQQRSSSSDLFFSAGFSNDMVLQRAPAKVAIYGLVAHSNSHIEIIVDGESSSYTIQATVDVGAGSGTICPQQCVNAKHCCVGKISSYQHPSCAMGCIIAECTSSLEECQQTCKDADNKCEYTVCNNTLQMCSNCPKGCDASDGVTECLQGCEFAYATPKIYSWKAFLKPMNTGGSYTITVNCTSGCSRTTTPLILKRVTFGDIWYCSGQSNMALALHYTYSAPGVTKEILAGKYSNIRLFSYGGMSNEFEEIHPAYATTTGANAWVNVTWAAAQPEDPKGTLNPFHSFSATCFYFAQALTDQLGKDAPPIGLIQSAVGGTKIEAWMSNESLTTCTDVDLSPGVSPPSRLYYGMVAPFVNMTIKGWLWYQGENNCGGVMGNSLNKSGYGCEMVELVSLWRRSWSVVKGTTDPNAPFGVVSLAAGGSEGHDQNMAAMRWSQSGNYGVLPNPAMPNTFLAHAFDIGDPWANGNTDRNNCSHVDPVTGHYGPDCVPWNPSKWDEALRPLAPLVRENVAPTFMGGIHPRIKYPVGRRLAVAAKNLIFGGKSPYTGPMLAGCTLKFPYLEVRFNTSLLRDDTILVQNFDSKLSGWSLKDSSSMMVQVDDIWIPVSVAASTSSSVQLDLQDVKGTVQAIKYGWPLERGADICCPHKKEVQGFSACIPASCPIITKNTNLPANPFLAHIVKGKCKCTPPQTCNN